MDYVLSYFQKNYPGKVVFLRPILLNEPLDSRNMLSQSFKSQLETEEYDINDAVLISLPFRLFDSMRCFVISVYPDIMKKILKYKECSCEYC